MARHDVWQKIFFKLFDNGDNCADNSMWEQFKAKNLSKEDIAKSFTNQAFDNFTNAKAKLSELSARASNSSELVEEMKKEPVFEDEVWKKLIFVIRDRESRPLDSNKTICIKVGGHVMHMNNEDLEEKLTEEMPDLMISQTCVPELLVYNKADQLSSEGLRQKLKDMYEHEVKEILEEKQRDNPLRKEEQLKQIRRETEKQTLADIKKTSEANALQKRKADESEAIVQRAIFKSAQEYGIPLTVFRGINTLNDVARYLSDFGIQCSNFGRSNSKECEHDVAVVAALPTGLVVSFIQVRFAHYWEMGP